MKRNEIRKKISEMIKDDREFIQKKIDKALASGAIDYASYPNDYRLPKIILYAIYTELVNQRCPLDKTNLEEAKNLSHFI